MGDGALDELMKAEKEANSIVEKAREQARVIIETAENEARKDKDARLKDFQDRRKRALSASEMEAQKEAEKIRNDGIEVARGLDGRMRSGIPRAMDQVLKMLLGGQ
ncbi:MAG: hypothetical protein JW939_00145 [Candidatus Thermoplasmatota archaeon]|nr:hypothetical protein [Candidatus Thermoplasmatota archaeon]